MEKSKFSPLNVSLNAFFLCVIVYFIEYKFLYSNVITLFGSTIISTIFAILVVFGALYLLNLKPSDIGFTKKASKIIIGTIAPMIILGICTLLSIFLIKHFISTHVFILEIDFKISVSRLGANSGIVSFIIAIIVAAITAFMLEIMLRGLILQIATSDIRFYAANTLNIVLTIIWHLLIYIFSAIFSNMEISTFLISILFVSIIYGIAAARKSLYIKATGSIWLCLSDCFLSLFIIRNISFTINLPAGFSPSNKIESLINFLASNSVNSTYLTIAFICFVNILSFIIMALYYHIRKKHSQIKYVKQLKQETL